MDTIFWVFLIGIPSVIVITFMLMGSDNKRTERIILQHLGGNSLEEAMDSLFGKALNAHKAGDYLAETEEYWKAVKVLERIFPNTSYNSAVLTPNSSPVNLGLKFLLSSTVNRLGLFQVPEPICSLNPTVRLGVRTTTEMMVENTEARELEREILMFGEDWIKHGLEIYPLTQNTSVKISANGKTLKLKDLDWALSVPMSNQTKDGLKTFLKKLEKQLAKIAGSNPK
jgi:hypothetical protein